LLHVTERCCSKKEKKRERAREREAKRNGKWYAVLKIFPWQTYALTMNCKFIKERFWKYLLVFSFW
jgi:membrane protein YqaA with SNARE-associated domain